MKQCEQCIGKQKELRLTCGDGEFCSIPCLVDHPTKLFQLFRSFNETNNQIWSPSVNRRVGWRRCSLVALRIVWIMDESDTSNGVLIHTDLFIAANSLPWKVTNIKDSKRKDYARQRKDRYVSYCEIKNAYYEYNIHLCILYIQCKSIRSCR